MILATQPDLDLVGDASTGDEAVALTPVTRPDVILMDIRMPDTDGIEATRRILDRPGDLTPRVLILITFDMDQYVYEALRAGASGFLLNDVPPEQLCAGIRMVHNGEALLAPTITRRLIEEFTTSARRAKPASAAVLHLLSPRESEVSTARSRIFQPADRGLSRRRRDDSQNPRDPQPHQTGRARSRSGCRSRL